MLQERQYQILRTVEEIARGERRLTLLELTQKAHHKRILALEKDAAMVREAIWKLTRGALMLMFGLLLDHHLNAGGLLKALLGH